MIVTDIAIHLDTLFIINGLITILWFINLTIITLTWCKMFYTNKSWIFMIIWTLLSLIASLALFPTIRLIEDVTVLHGILFTIGINLVLYIVVTLFIQVMYYRNFENAFDVPDSYIPTYNEVQ